MNNIWVVTAKRDYNEMGVILLFDGSVDIDTVKEQIQRKYPRIVWDYSDDTNGKISKYCEIDIYLMGIDKIEKI